MVKHQHLLRAMDVLGNHEDEVDDVMSGLLRSPIDQNLAIVFYDMTTIRAAGLLQEHRDIHTTTARPKKAWRRAKSCWGWFNTAEGLPLYHEVFAGNTGGVITINVAIKRINKRFPGR